MSWYCVTLPVPVVCGNMLVKHGVALCAETAQAKVKNTKSIAEIRKEGVDSYHAIYLPGGHGACT